MTESHAIVTQHSPSEERNATELQNSDHVKRCEEPVEQYRQGENEKLDTILALHETLLTLQPSEEEIALPGPLEFTSGSLMKSIDQTQMCMAERPSLLARLCPKIPLADRLSNEGHHPKKRKLEDQISPPPLLVQENMKTARLHPQSSIRLTNHSSLGSEKEKSMLPL